MCVGSHTRGANDVKKRNQETKCWCECIIIIVAVEVQKSFWPVCDEIPLIIIKVLKCNIIIQFEFSSSQNVSFFCFAQKSLFIYL